MTWRQPTTRPSAGARPYPISDSGEREAGYGEAQSLESVGAEERQAVLSTEKDEGEGGAVTVANLDPGGRLVSSGAVSQDYRDLSVGRDFETSQQSGWKLAERGARVYQAFHGSRRLIERSDWTDMDLN